MKRNILFFVCLPTSTPLLFGLNLTTGSVQIPFADVLDTLCGRFTEKESWEYIILENQSSQTLTTILCGTSLSVCGLMLQAAFHSPLAGPDVPDISPGTGLGVALVMLLLGRTVPTSIFTVSGSLAILITALTEAIAVAAPTLFLSALVRNSILLLIVGIMVGYVSSSVVSLLNFSASEEGAKSCMMWGIGNFGAISMNHIPLFSILCLTGIITSFLLVEPLNILLLGPQYAESLGINTRQVCSTLLAVVGLLTAITTAFRGPTLFIELATPYIAHLLFRTENHRIFLPGTVLGGAVIALLCNFVCCPPGESDMIPLNVVIPLIGAPVIIYVIIRRG